MISTAVSVLEDTETLVGALKGLARRHTTYGVTSVHYTFVGLALVQTLVHTLAENWNDELGAAWVHCYSLMMTVMIPIQTEFDEKKANGEAETKGAEE